MKFEFLKQFILEHGTLMPPDIYNIHVGQDGYKNELYEIDLSDDRHKMFVARPYVHGNGDITMIYSADTRFRYNKTKDVIDRNFFRFMPSWCEYRDPWRRVNVTDDGELDLGGEGSVTFLREEFYLTKEEAEAYPEIYRKGHKDELISRYKEMIDSNVKLLEDCREDIGRIEKQIVDLTETTNCLRNRLTEQMSLT